jgi:hypothetical protein
VYFTAKDLLVHVGIIEICHDVTMCGFVPRVEYLSPKMPLIKIIGCWFIKTHKPGSFPTHAQHDRFSQNLHCKLLIKCKIASFYSPFVMAKLNLETGTTA